MDYGDLSLTAPGAAAFSSSSSSCTSESSVSTSSNSSFSNISSTNLPNPTVISTPISSSANSVFKTYGHNYSAPYSSNMNTSMTSSTSQIFATAASFNISPLDTVYYSRETIHYLAKFLSLHSKDVLFSSLYAFAPDNLAWLWSLFDWDEELDLAKIETQDSFNSFKTTLVTTSSNSNQHENDVKLSEEQIHTIDKIFSESPLVRYVYREKMMIADVFKLLEHVQNIQEDVNIARALFVLYFPRFSAYIPNPLKNSIAPKILKVNISRIKSVDDILVSLVRTRYTNLNEYKHKIREGIDLPSYIRTLLDENNYCPILNKQEPQINNEEAKLNSISINSSLNHNESSSNSSGSSMQASFEHQKVETNSCNEPIQMINEKHLQNFTDESYTSLIQSLCQNPSAKTNDYLNLLQKYHINDSLDHVSFDSRLLQQKHHEQQLAGIDDLNTLVDDDIIQNNQSIFLLSPNSQNLHQKQQNTFHCAQNKKDIDNNNKILNNKSINEEENSYINEENYLTNDQIYKCVINSKLRATASVFKVDPNKYYTHTTNYNTQGMEKLQINTHYNKYAKKFHKNEYSSSKSGFLVNSPLSPLSPNHIIESNESFVWGNNNNTPKQSTKPVQTPLSIMTNTANLDELNLYSFTSPNPASQNFNNTSFATSNRAKYDQPFHTESMKYIKASTFLSPAIRQNLNTSKFSEFSNVSSSSNSSGHNSLNGSKFNLNRNGNDFHSFANINFKRNDFAPSSSDNNTFSPRGYHSVYPNKTINSLHHVWFGRLPPKIYSENALYSRKIFLGGLPWDVNQQHLLQMLNKYGPVKLEIPGKDQKHPRASTICKTQERSTPGYVYIIFEHESSVQRLLLDCRKEIKNGGEHYYYTIFVPSITGNSSNTISPIPNAYQDNFNFNFSNSKRSKAKEVEVIPWNQEDTSYMPYKTINQPSKIDARLTVFVGALHGMLNAQGLAKVMNEIIGEVTHAGLDSDKYKYPIGSGRVTFKNRQSYVKAISAKFVTIKANQDPHDPSPKFEKTIQIDPYLEDAKCCQCDDKSYFFCRNEHCLDYYCQDCWSNKHETKGNGDHIPISRQNKPSHVC